MPYSPVRASFNSASSVNFCSSTKPAVTASLTDLSISNLSRVGSPITYFFIPSDLSDGFPTPVLAESGVYDIPKLILPELVKTNLGV